MTYPAPHGWPSVLAVTAALVLPIGSVEWAPPTAQSRRGRESFSRSEKDSRPLLELHDGDRVVLLGNTFVERDRHHGQLETMLRSRFPGVRFLVRNLAWPGDTTTVQLRPLNFGTLEEHLATHKPTVAFVGYGMNESFEGRRGLAGYLHGYGHILDLLASAGTRVVVLSPIRHENLGPPLPDPTAHNEQLGSYVEATRRLAEGRGLSFVDLFSTVVEPCLKPPVQPLTDNGIHLTAQGYCRAAEVMACSLGWGPNRWRVEISSGRPVGAVVSDVQVSADCVRFQAVDRLLPTPAPEGAPANADRQTAQRTLKVVGLGPGRHTLRIDGAKVAEASAAEWAAGMVLIAGPAFDQVRRLRREVQRKDRLFFNRWRALNGEYIYGRRSQKGAGNAGNPTFPVEMADFDRLLGEADARLAELSHPRPHLYELTAR